MSDLIAELKQAERENVWARTCPACVLISSTEDPELRSALTEALAGTIGKNKLAVILSRYGHNVGWRTITRHREEGHAL